MRNGHPPVDELIGNAPGIEARAVPQLSQDRAHSVRLVGPAHHYRTKRSRKKPYDPRDADVGDYWAAAQQNNAADPSRMPLREAEDPHVAYRGAITFARSSSSASKAPRRMSATSGPYASLEKSIGVLAPHPGRSRTIERKSGSWAINDGHEPGPAVPCTKRIGSPEPTSSTRRRAAGASRSRNRSFGSS